MCGFSVSEVEGVCLMRQKSFLTTYLWNPRGFSLIELVVVIAVIGILAGILASNLISQMPKYRLNGATRQLAWDLMAARIQAIGRNRKSKVFFPNNHQYKTCYDANNDGTVDDCEGNGLTKDIQRYYSDVTIIPNNEPIFLPKGTVTNLPSIIVSNPAGSKIITISIAGRVKIK
ncbi:hypothetical protein NKDENANG_02977 [Candidatus Entotheonellaceae bacterium PAL068K]